MVKLLGRLAASGVANTVLKNASPQTRALASAIPLIAPSLKRNKKLWIALGLAAVAVPLLLRKKDTPRR